jgi:hypothetical protein
MLVEKPAFHSAKGWYVSGIYALDSGNPAVSVATSPQAFVTRRKAPALRRRGVRRQGLLQ